MDDTFVGREYISAFKQHYPHLLDGDKQSTIDDVLHIGIIDAWIRKFDEVGVDRADRFQPIAARPWGCFSNAWTVAGGGPDVRKVGAYGAYKGLINLKPATDLVLYSNLLWELKPKTILEFGSLQGGSALWFADHLESICGHGEVHSFELCIECIHPRASHPRLHFHKADVRDLGTLDAQLLERLPHPWLVVDDCHENLENLIPFITQRMTAGDYYVIEDVFMRATAPSIMQAAMAMNALGFLVDTKYTDAFGMNVTCAPNGWLIKR